MLDSNKITNTIHSISISDDISFLKDDVLVVNAALSPINIEFYHSDQKIHLTIQEKNDVKFSLVADYSNKEHTTQSVLYFIGDKKLTETNHAKLLTDARIVFSKILSLKTTFSSEQLCIFRSLINKTFEEVITDYDTLNTFKTKTHCIEVHRTFGFSFRFTFSDLVSNKLLLVLDFSLSKGFSFSTPSIECVSLISFDEEDSLFVSFYDAGLISLCEFVLSLICCYKNPKFTLAAETKLFYILSHFPQVEEMFDVATSSFNKEFVYDDFVVNYGEVLKNANSLSSYMQLCRTNVELNPWGNIKKRHNKAVNLNASSMEAYKTSNSHALISKEDIETLDFTALLHHLEGLNYMNSSFRENIAIFLEKYSFVTERDDYLSLMSKHYLYTNIPDDFREFFALSIDTPSKELFEESFGIVLDNMLFKITSLYNAIDKQLSDELDSILSLAEKRSDSFKDILSKKTKNTI